jgi:hypothetical protein
MSDDQPFSNVVKSVFEKDELPGFSDGGKTPGAKDDIAGVVHGGEFVVKAGPAQKFASVLTAINEGRKMPGFADGGSVGNFSLANERMNLSDLGRIFRKEDFEQSQGNAASPVNVSMNITTPDVGGFRRSQSQVAAEMGRMIRQGQARQT